MKVTKLGTVSPGQDGAVWKGHLFRFDHKGNCSITDLSDLSEKSVFTLHKAELLAPHSNSVVFGNSASSPEDGIPLLYTNIYNNCAGLENKRKGQCLVYRLKKQDEAISSTLAGILRIGFTDDPLWCSAPLDDVRPYGNFVADTENSLLHVFTMHDSPACGRFFTFELPPLTEFTETDELGIPVFTLEKRAILSCFDTAYPRFIQGACFHRGLIYSVEGFTNSTENPPAIRIIDPRERREIFFEPFSDFGLTLEPELIDFNGDVCIYGDNKGNLYRLDF